MRRHATATAISILYSIIQAHGAEPNLTADRTLWKIAQSACAGESTKSVNLLNVLKLDTPIHIVMQRPTPGEIVIVSSRLCRAPIWPAQFEFIIGHYASASEAFYYKISERAEVIEAAHSRLDPVGSASAAPSDFYVYEAIAPESQTGTVKAFPKVIQDDFSALITAVNSKWGR